MSTGSSVLHELYQLAMSNLANGVSDGLTSAETLAIFKFVERAVGALF